jgi:hypothetical protein
VGVFGDVEGGLAGRAVGVGGAVDVYVEAVGEELEDRVRWERLRGLLRSRVGCGEGEREDEAELRHFGLDAEAGAETRWLCERSAHDSQAIA